MLLGLRHGILLVLRVLLEWTALSKSLSPVFRPPIIAIAECSSSSTP